MTEIRDSQPADADGILRVHVEAFPTSAEADLVEKLQSDGDDRISLVASVNDAIVGHILFSRMDVHAEGAALHAIALAPVAVRSDWQGRGIGSQLIRVGIERAKAEGWQIIFLLGEPAYYRRFGFTTEAARPFASPYARAYFQALPVACQGQPTSGTAEYARAFAGLG